MKLTAQELREFINNRTEKHTFVLHECIMDRRKEDGQLSILTIEQEDLILCDWSMIDDYDQLDIDDLQRGELSFLNKDEQDYLLGVVKDEPESMVILVCDGVIVSSIE